MTLHAYINLQSFKIDVLGPRYSMNLSHAEYVMQVHTYYAINYHTLRYLPTIIGTFKRIVNTY